MHYLQGGDIQWFQQLFQLRNTEQLVILLELTQLGHVFRLRNGGDLEALIDELNALTDKKTLLQLYNMATAEPYSFLFIKLNAKKLNDMFYVRYEKKLEIE